jgi:hypothetical protein
LCHDERHEEEEAADEEHFCVAVVLVFTGEVRGRVSANQSEREKCQCKHACVTINIVDSHFNFDLSRPFIRHFFLFMPINWGVVAVV